MKTEPIICQGAELEGVLAALRDRGVNHPSLETGVGGNAGYRVNYFERGIEKSPMVVPAADEAVACAGKDSSKQEPSALTNSESEAARNTQGVRGDKMSAILTPESHSKKKLPSGSTPDALNPMNAGKEPENPAGKSTKGSDQVTPEELRVSTPASGGGIQTESRVEDCHQHSNLPEWPDVIGVGDSPVIPDDLSIETRMADLQAKLAASGRIKRSKSSTPKEHARLPYSD